MTAIRTTARVGSDGNVTVPVGVQESGRIVEVTVVPASAPATVPETINGLPAAEWWEIFNRLAGSIDDPGFQRPPQEPYEPRQPLDWPTCSTPTFALITSGRAEPALWSVRSDG